MQDLVSCTQAGGNEGQRARLVLAHALLKAVARVEAEAAAGPHAPGAAAALQSARSADPVLHQQAHASAGVVPPLLQQSSVSFESFIKFFAKVCRNARAQRARTTLLFTVLSLI